MAVKLGIVLAGSRRDHRHADPFGWYRSWQDDVSPRSSERNGQGAVAEEVHAEAAHYLHRQHAEVSDRYGSVCGGSLPQPYLREQGHDVKLIPAQFVRPFVKSNKNDFLDAEAIAEAVDRQNMRFVPIKTDDQLDLQAIHRVRDRLIARRTSVINQLRAFLLERGMTFATTPFKLKVTFYN
jgi:transposase